MKSNIKVLPIRYVLIFGLLMYGCALIFPNLSTQFTYSWIVAIAVFGLGVTIIVISGIQFFKAATTVNPLTPDKTSKLVVSGIYSYSRNPMYVGFLLFLIALAIYLGNFVALLFLPLFIITINHLQIQCEETMLEALFDDEYRDYIKKVRRWI